jgi:hypothetical protein
MSTKFMHGRWTAHCAALRDFVAANGRLPKASLGGEEAELYKWVAYVRARHRTGRMEASRVQELLAIDGVLNPGLSRRQSEFKVWIDAHGRRPWRSSADPVESSFATLLHTLRSHGLKGRLKPAVVELLLSVPDGVTDAEATAIKARLDAKLNARKARAEASVAGVTRLDGRWNQCFADLQGWVETHGTLPRRRTENPEEYRLANWVNVQRVQFRYNNLADGWAERLRTVPGLLDPQPRSKSDLTFARRVADFHAAHGRLPRAAVPAPEGTAGINLARLRKLAAEGTLAPEPTAVLAAVPGALIVRPAPKSPFQRLADLEEFVKATGTFPTKGADGLSNWAARAKRGEGSRSADPAVAKEIQRRVKELHASVPHHRNGSQTKIPA